MEGWGRVRWLLQAAAVPLVVAHNSEVELNKRVKPVDETGRPPGQVTRKLADHRRQRQGAYGHCGRRQPCLQSLLQHDQIAHNFDGAASTNYVIDASAD